MTDQVSRRAFLVAVGAAGAVWLTADPELVQAALVHARKAAALPPPYRFDALTPEQAADFEAIAMRIFPSDGTPGAKEAGVVHFIDKGFTTFAAEGKEPMLKSLADLNQKAGAPFATLPPARQDELLKSIEHEPFFGQMRFATIGGVFANPSYGGNQNQVGWKHIGFENHGIHQPPFGYYDAEVLKGG
ncbi:MAG TPA: gluconate 2-dehydrogenase subunit 3 family protein [Gemmatimonadales bacterium]|nr:gluconate 2-dehydrogenase subunit 3 family protein [Gemmatimonadales bacterium]